MSAPRVSILMAVYNGAGHLPAAIESILSQTFSDFEFLIVDDGSTDGTPAILAEYTARDSRIVVTTNARNLGLTRSLNVGLAQCRGEFVARQDADDLSDPGRLAAQVAHLDAHPRLLLLGTRYRAFRNEDDPGRVYPIPVGEREVAAALVQDNAFGHGTVMFRRAPELRYDETFAVAQDYDLFARLALNGPVDNLEQVLYHWRVHPGAVSARRREEQRAVRLAVSNAYIHELLARLDLETLLRAALGNRLDNERHRHLRRELWSATADAEARRTLRSAFLHLRRHSTARSLPHLAVVPVLLRAGCGAAALSWAAGVLRRRVGGRRGLRG